MFNVYRAPPHPSHSYTRLGSAETIEGAFKFLPTMLIACDEDDANPGHYDAISQAGTLYSIVPAGSRWTPSRVISRLEA